ncbi:hypothetical protein [Sphingobacterium suaedae]|uniref:Tetratricopeptide repeat protein n=1 Tax=Sphingobacterium suaedae TaxID=1686402 RepID=A0ABW5KEK5_9SPHI
MNYADLEQLFYEGDIERCIIDGEQYLKESPENTQVLFLLATAYHDIVFQDGPQIVFDAIQNYTIPYLRRILSLDTTHKHALFSILDYPLGNQLALRNNGHHQTHITRQNADEFVIYANHLIETDDLFVDGYDFLWKIYEGLDEPERQILVADGAMSAIRDRFQNNRELRDKHTSYFWIKKIYLLSELPAFDNKELLPLITEVLPSFVSYQEKHFVDLAELAWSQNDLDLALKILLVLLDYNESTSIIVEHFARWYDRLNRSISEGYHHEDMYYFQLMIERNYAGAVGIAPDFYYHHAHQMIRQFPECYYGYHFVGTYLFENSEYEEAIPYFKNALDLLPASITARRYIESYIYVHHAVPSVPEMKSHPKELYDDATYLDDLADEIDIPELQRDLLLARLAFYEQSYHGFHRYFDQNEFQSFYASDYHQFAMCCNNLAIVHEALENYIPAMSLAEEGLRYADFWELHATHVETLIKAKCYEQAKAALDRYFEHYEDEEVPVLKHLIFMANRLEVNYYLYADQETYEDAKILLNQVYDYGVANSGMDNYDYQDFEAAKTAIQAIYFRCIEKRTNAEKIAIFEKHAARYPHEANPQYMLMQLYHDTAQYASCNKAAHVYLKNKPAYLLDAFDKARTTHFILKTHLLCKEYQQGLIVYEENYRMMRDVLSDNDYITWLYYVIELKFALELEEEVYSLIREYKGIYARLNWSYDKNMEKVYLLEAQTLYKEGRLKEAHAVLDKILYYTNHNPVADIYKKQWKKPGFFSKFGF